MLNRTQTSMSRAVSKIWQDPNDRRRRGSGKELRMITLKYQELQQAVLEKH